MPAETRSALAVGLVLAGILEPRGAVVLFLPDRIRLFVERSRRACAGFREQMERMIRSIEALVTPDLA